MVKRVIKDPARSAGVERGDILLMFNGENIDDLEHFHELTENIEEGKTYALLVLRSGAARFLAIKIDKK
jgi:serine protease Do